MAKKITNKFYRISNTDKDTVIRITKSECYNEDGDKVKITLQSYGVIVIAGEEAGSEEYTLEEFFDYVDGNNLTFEQSLYCKDYEVHKITDKSGNIISVEIGCEKFTKKEALELMKKLKWIK